MAGGDRGRGARALGVVPADRGDGQHRQGERQADADQELWLQRQCPRRPRQDTESREAAGDRDPARQRRRGRRPGATAIQRAANAASGIAETVAAAAIGERPHPSVSRMTSRKRAPVSPAESSARPTSGRRSGAPLGPGSGGAGGHRRQRDQQQERHLEEEDRLPVEELRQQAAERRADGDADRRGGPPGRSGELMAAPQARQQLDGAGDGEAPPAAWARGHRSARLASRTRRRRSRRRRRGRRPADQPARGCERAIRTAGRISRARTTLKAVRTQETPKTVASYSWRMLGEREGDDRGVGEDDADGQREADLGDTVSGESPSPGGSQGTGERLVHPVDDGHLDGRVPGPAVTRDEDLDAAMATIAELAEEIGRRRPTGPAEREAAEAARRPTRGVRRRGSHRGVRRILDLRGAVLDRPRRWPSRRR